MKLFRNCRAYAFDPAARTYRTHDAFVVDGTRIADLGSSNAGGGVERFDLGGATVLPAFADCHVHLTDTGYLLGERNLSGARGANDFAGRVAALPDEPYVFGGNYDDSAWTDGASASAEPLERHFANRLAMLTRIDGHSSLVNRKTLAHLRVPADTEGLERDAAGEPTGRLFLTANWTAQAAFMAQLPEAMRRAADRRAYELALAQGALNLHVQLIGFGSRAGYAAEIDALNALGPARWHPKICELDPALAHSFGLPYVGGDVFLDGSIGSGTAAMFEPYCDRPGNGRLAHGDDAVEAFFAASEALGISAGVHAIGDRAIEQCLAAWERVLGGKPSPRCRHFIEHFEVASPAQIARCARLGIFLSMQPQFDAVWGGAGGMYEARLGSERMHSMNALRSALDAGATLCGGDDSPVCSLSPLEGMAAACGHHNPGQRLKPAEALTMYTYDAARLAHAEARTGALAPGFDADFVVLDRDPLPDGSFSRARVLETWCGGERVYARA